LGEHVVHLSPAVEVIPEASRIPVPEPVPETISLDSHWPDRGACNPRNPESTVTQEDIDNFYGGRDDVNLRTGERNRMEKEAKKICGKCAVQAACLDYALTNDEKFGVWGGETVDERKKRNRRRLIR